MKNDKISFPCTWSMGVTVITAITVIILVASTYFIWTDDFPSSMLWLKYTLIVVFIATIIGGLGYMPIRLTIGNDKIILHRLFGAINIPIKDIIAIYSSVRTVRNMYSAAKAGMNLLSLSNSKIMRINNISF